MTAAFAWEPISRIKDEAQAIVTDYWRDLWPYKDAPMDPDWERMAKLEEAGVFRVWCARVDGRLAGFIAFNLMSPLAAKSTLFAFDAGHYLDPAYRDDPWLGIRMWRVALTGLKELGVRITLAHDNVSDAPDARSLRAFFKRLGFKDRSMTYSRIM